MAVTYSWTFGVPLVAPSENSFTNVVNVAPYTYSATDGVNTVSVSGNVPLPPPNAQTFVPFASLTQQNFIDWCTGGLNVPQLQAGLAAGLVSMPAPALVVVPMKPSWMP
jgi:hypothetical protein